MSNSGGPPYPDSAKKKKFSKPLRVVFLALCILAIAYAYEFQWRLVDSKGQFQDDYAWEVLAYETLGRQYRGMPEMRVTYGKPTRRFCNFWNFEAIWGSCVTVKIGLDVRDYRPEYGPIVDREVARLADQLRTPCVLLSTLALENEVNLGKALGCNGRKKSFRLHIWVNDVTVSNERGPADRPNRWSLKTVKHLYTTDFVDGEL